jgi:hypothetical protein
MKAIKLIGLCTILLFVKNAQAQEDYEATRKIAKPLTKKLFLGVTGGWDSHFGQGALLTYLAKPHHAISIGGGSELLWKNRFAIHYDAYAKKQMLGWSIGTGFSFGFAPKTKFADSIPIVKDTTITGSEMFIVQPHNILLWNVNIKKTFPLYKNGRYYFYTGYATRLRSTYTVESNNDPKNLAVQSFKFFSPGGFSAGVGVIFGIW